MKFIIIYFLLCGWLGAALAICGIFVSSWQFWLLTLSAHAMSGYALWSARDFFEKLITGSMRK